MANTASKLNKSELTNLVESYKYLPSYKWMETALKYFGVARMLNDAHHPDIVRFIASGLGCTIKPDRLVGETAAQSLEKMITGPSDAYATSIGLSLDKEYNPNRICNKPEREILNDETAWCSAFVNHVMKSNGYSGTIGNRRLSARSWLKWGVEVEKEQANFGDIIVVSRPNGGPQAGHVGFFVKKHNNYYQIYGGNQSSKSWVCVRNYPQAWFLGFRQPAA